MLWDPREYCVLATLRGHDGSVFSLCVCRNIFGADILASGGDDKMIRIWDLSTHQTSFTLAGHEGSVYCLSCFTNADGVPMLVSTGMGDPTMKVWDLESRVVVDAIQGELSMRSWACVAGADGRVLAVCTGGRGDEAALRLYDLSPGSITACESVCCGARTETRGNNCVGGQRGRDSSPMGHYIEESEGKRATGPRESPSPVFLPNHRDQEVITSSGRCRLYGR
jgi:WD40 repeat protein